MSSDFWKYLHAEYKRNDNLQKIIIMLKKHKNEQSSDIKFTYKNKLLYYTDEKYNQLIILKSLLTDIFWLAYNENSYTKLYQSY